MLHPLQVHEEEDALNVWMYDAVENNGKYTRWQALAQLMTALGLMAGLYGLSVLYDAPSRNPAVSAAPQATVAPTCFPSCASPSLCRHQRSTPLTTCILSVVATQTEHSLRQTGRRRCRSPTGPSPLEMLTTHSACTISGHAGHMFQKL